MEREPEPEPEPELNEPAMADGSPMLEGYNPELAHLGLADQMALQAPQKSKAPMIIGIVVVLLAIAGGG